MRNLQKLAAGILEEVLDGAALHQVLPHRLQQLQTPGERGALQDIVYGSLRLLGRLDCWLAAPAMCCAISVTRRDAVVIALKLSLLA